MTVIISGDNGVSDVDGSAGTPAIRGTDANTGIFFGSDIIGFSEGGTECARFNADAQFVAAAGTASLPVITTTGDVNTGIFFPAADTIGFAEGGAEAMRIDNDGNVGIGSTSPSTFNDASAGGRNVVIQSTGTGRGVLVFASEQTGGANEPLGIINFIDSNSTNASFRGARMLGMRGADDNSAYLRFDTANSGSVAERMRLASNGDFFCQGMYDATTGSAANLFVAPNGSVARSTSSLKYKRDVQDATHGLTEVMQLRPVIYKGKSENDGEKVFGGLIAEEVNAVGLVEFVQYDPEGNPDSLAYGNMVSLAFKAIQELKAINDAQASRIETLEAKVAALEAGNV